MSLNHAGDWIDPFLQGWNGNGVQLTDGGLSYPDYSVPLQPAVNSVTISSCWPYCGCRSNAFEQVQDAILEKCRIAIESGNFAEAKEVLELAAKLKELKNG
jgi:hypothetical protein